MNIMVFDTETTNLEKPFCYNIGYVIYNTDTKQIEKKADFVVEQVWHNPMLFVTAYYADKRDLYVSRMRGQTCKLNKFGYITQQMYRDIKDYGIEHAYAYNSSFDEKVFAYNCDWFKCINPFDSVAVHDIRGYVHKVIAFTDEYKEFCEANELFTESGNYSTTAEAVYRYLLDDTEFEEEHTALADSVIELEILDYCVEQGCDWNTDYPVYRTISRQIRKEYTVIDHEGTAHKFPYTDKRKISGVDGVRLTIKEK
jgi:hypothetical protein